MLIPIAYFIVCTLLLTLPGSAIPKDNWFDRVWMDKWVHLAMFFLLVFLWFRALKDRSGSTRSLLLVITLSAIVYGVLMEWVQHRFVPYRSYDPGDMIADAAGSLLGAAFCYGRYIKR